MKVTFVLLLVLLLGLLTSAPVQGAPQTTTCYEHLARTVVLMPEDANDPGAWRVLVLVPEGLVTIAALGADGWTLAAIAEQDGVHVGVFTRAGACGREQ
jgi:hypothetical protein